MPIHVQWAASSALVAKLDAIRAAAGPGGRANTRALGDIRQIVIEAHTENLLGHGLEGVDRYGKTLAPAADSTMRNPRRGFGPVLCPHGLLSRFITNFEAVWVAGGKLGNTLAMRYRDILSTKGKSFVQYHLTGATKPGTKWVLPRRDVGGIGPANGPGWAKIRARMARFAEDVLKGN